MEVMIATLIVGLMLVPALNTVGSCIRSRTALGHLHSGRGLARQLMTEVLQTPYEDPESPGGPLGTEMGEGTGNRADWDDVDDYTGWNRSPPEDKDGVTLTGFNGWTRAVSIDWVDPTAPQTTVGSDQGLKRITVTVTDAAGQQTLLATLRSNAGVMQQQPTTSCPNTYLTWVACQLQIDSGTATGGTNLANHAQGP